MKFLKWEKWQVNFLLDSYNRMSSKEIAEDIGRTTSSVVWKLSSMGITRSFDYIHNIRSTSRAAVARREFYKALDEKFALPNII